MPQSEYDGDMAENLIPTVVADDAQRGDARPRHGRALRLSSLAPKFNPKHHQVYFDLLTRAIGHADTRNIALTGAYGTGKSSILAQLRADPEYESRTVSLSLSTTVPRLSRPQEDHSPDESPTSRVNQIQKEIVKQLLYRTAVSEVPQSRFHRATVPRLKRDFWIAMGIGLGLSALLFLLGPLHPFISSWFDGTPRHILAYAITTAILVGFSWVLVRVLRARPFMSASVNAVSTTVTLTKKSDSYFDAYLDEIVYFFEATKTDIVLIEDIDRFEDAQIFDTLRALNGLLNGSRQVGRQVVFVYAIRDSVFEKIDSLESSSSPVSDVSSDHVKESLQSASRTKFFDVIIPVVPFVSPDNARDVMTRAMKSADFKIKPALIRLAARHVADMRMIHNIRNEFEVYRHELVASKRRLPDITDDLVFAIVLYKNTHLADYERIRHRDSSLDHLFVAWRAFVTAASSRTQARLIADRPTFLPEARAQELGERILQLREILDDSVTAPLVVTMDSELEEAITTEDGWNQVVADGELSFSLSRNGASIASFAFNNDRLGEFLNADINPAAWAQKDDYEAAARTQDLKNVTTFLRHHTWAQLVARPDLTAELSSFSLTAEESARLQHIVGDRQELTFAELVDAILPSELARELVRRGSLTSHFALYSSTYYGRHLSEAAREYIYRFVSPGEPDFAFPLRRRDVRQILREQKANANDHADLFSDPSVLNVGIINYLLAERPAAASVVAHQIAQMETERSGFLDAYSSHGDDPPALFALLASHWPGTTHYAATASAIPDEKRIDVVDAALSMAHVEAPDPSTAVAQFIAKNYESLASVTAPESQQHARAVIGVLENSQQTLVDLRPLNSHARAAALTFGVFPLTETNLRAFIPQGPIELGSLRRSNRELYDLIVRQVRRYLPLVKKPRTQFALVTEPTQLALLIRDMSKLNAADLPAVLGVISDVQVPSFDDIPPQTWQAVASTQRTEPTAPNVAAYISAFGVDRALATLLKPRRIYGALALEEDQRRELAHAILRADDVIPSTLARVKTASTLHPGILDPADLTPESGDLVARLVAARLIPDDPTAFTPTLMVDWVTLEKTVKASKRFRTFVSPTVFPPVWVPNAIRSTILPQPTKVAIINNLEGLLTVATRPQAVKIASTLVEKGWRIRTARIKALIAAGVHGDLIVPLLANDLKNIDLEASREIMLALGGDYALVARGGSKRPSFRADKPHQEVLERFVGTTVKRIKEDDFKRKGRRLVVYLC